MRRALAALVALLACAPAQAAEPVWIAHLPSVKTAKPPMIVLMHGAGSDERDMIGLWKDLPQEFVVVSPRAPFGSAGRGFRWYEAKTESQYATSRAEIAKVVDGALKEYGADPARVFVGGFSQGGVMAYDLALKEPGRYRGAIVMSGSLLTGAGKAGGTPFFIGHGTADNRIPFASAERAKAAMIAAGADVEFHAYPGMTHDVSQQEIADFTAWLRKRMN